MAARMKCGKGGRDEVFQIECDGSHCFTCVRACGSGGKSRRLETAAAGLDRAGSREDPGIERPEAR
jgi:hypothetical protein